MIREAAVILGLLGAAGVAARGQAPLPPRAPTVPEGTPVLIRVMPRIQAHLVAVQTPSRPDPDDEDVHGEEAELDRGGKADQQSWEADLTGIRLRGDLVLVPLPALFPFPERTTFDIQTKGPWVAAPVVALDPKAGVVILRAPTPVTTSMDVASVAPRVPGEVVAVQKPGGAWIIPIERPEPKRSIARDADVYLIPQAFNPGPPTGAIVVDLDGTFAGVVVMLEGRAAILPADVVLARATAALAAVSRVP